MSKMMFVFLLLCSFAIYNPEGVRDFARVHATEIGTQISSTLNTVDRLLPSFLRFGHR